MKYLLSIIILLSAAGFSFAQNPQKSEYRVRIKGEQISVTFQGKSHTIIAGDKIDAAKITDAKLLFANRKGEFTYLVVSVCGDSKEKSDDRQCGAGIECNLLWIKLDARWKTVAINSERYESCWATITSTDGYKINGHILTIEFDNFRDNKTTKLSYDADKAENGFQIESIPLKEYN